MYRRQRVALVLGLVETGVCFLASPALAQDGPEPVALRGSSGSAADASGQARAAGGEAAESDGAAAAVTKTARDPQFVIWTDALLNCQPTAAHNTMHNEFIVGWTTVQDAWTDDIWARRLRPDGTLLEYFNVASSAGEGLVEPAIAYCPLHDEYLIAYTNFYDFSGPADVEARRVAWHGGWMSDIFTVTAGVARHVAEQGTRNKEVMPSLNTCGQPSSSGNGSEREEVP